MWPCKTWAEFPALLLFLMGLMTSAVFFLRTQAWKCVAKGQSQLSFKRCLCPVFQGSKAWPWDPREVCQQPSAALVHPRGSAVPLRLHTWSSIGCGTGLCQARGAWGVVGLQPHGAPHTSGYGHLLSSAIVTRASFTALHPSPR